MSDSLHNRLHRLRWRVRRVLGLYGLSWTAAVVLGAALAVGLMDWLVHLDDPGVRLILGLGIVGAGGYVAWRFLLLPLLRPLGDVDLALRIERRFPGFNDSLASTVQFLQQGGDPLVGSPALQRHVVERTLHDVEQVELDDVVETRPLRRAGLAAVGVCGLVAVVAGLNPTEARIALSRLAFPLASNPWPKQTELRLLTTRFEPVHHPRSNPLRIARGETLELFVENLKGQPPDDLAIQYRQGEGEIVTERVRRTSVRDETGRVRDIGVARLAAVTGAMPFRAVGGDDRAMPWQWLRAVPPPTVEELHVMLTPPEYAARPVETLPPGVGHIQGLVGTRVEIEAAVNKPLGSARLRIKDAPPQDVELLDDGRRFRAAFAIEEAGAYGYWFELADRQGFANAGAPRYEIRGIADLPPEVSIDRPATDLQVTAEAVVPVRVIAKDDLGLRAIRLEYKLSTAESSPAGTVPLWSGETRPQQQTADYEWPLTSLRLQPGAQVVFYAEAEDDFDLDGRHVNRSISRTLTVVGPEEKKAEIAQRQGSLIDELEKVRQTQAAAREQTAELLTQLKTAGRLRPQDMDLLKRIEIDQRQIATRLTSPLDGLERRAQLLKEELRDNRLTDTELESRLDQIARELAVIREDHLPVIEQELTQARKELQAEGGAGFQPAREGPPPNDDGQVENLPHESLARGERNQQAVAESLASLLDQLTQWRDRRDLNGEVDDLIAKQREMNRLSAEVGQRTLGKSADRLSPQEQADLERLAGRQRGQADRLDQFAQRMDQMRQRPDAPPQQAETLQDAAAQLRREATAGRMREAAGQLQRNLIGEATAAQEQVLENLTDLKDTLQNRGTTDTETLVKKLKQAEQEIETLRKRQEELQRRLDEAMQNPDAAQRAQQLQQLRKEQQALREQTEEVARELRRLPAHDAGDAARRAAARMGQTAEELGDNAGAPAQRQQQETLDDLEQAQRELARQRQAAEERLARELLERIADQLKSMIDRQQTVIDETQRLEAERVANGGNWKRVHSLSLRDLAEVQRGLKQETDRLVESLHAAEVFALALEGAAQQMDRAARRLSERLTDEETVRAERDARQRFVDLVAALKPAENGGGQEQPQPQGDGGDGKQEGPQTDGIPHLAQLKMLRTLQAELLDRTTRLDQIRRNTSELTADQKDQLDQLALQQTRLADLARNLTRQFTKPAEAEPATDSPLELP